MWASSWHSPPPPTKFLLFGYYYTLYRVDNSLDLVCNDLAFTKQSKSGGRMQFAIIWRRVCRARYVYLQRSPVLISRSCGDSVQCAHTTSQSVCRRLISLHSLMSPLLIFSIGIAIKDVFLIQKLLRVTNLAVFHYRNIYRCHSKSHEISAYKLTWAFYEIDYDVSSFKLAYLSVNEHTDQIYRN